MFSKDIKLIFSDRKMLILLLFLVLLCAAGIFFCVNDMDRPAATLGIVDEDQTKHSALLATYFDENEVFTSYFTVLRGTREEMEEKFEKGELDIYVVLHKGFTEKLVGLENTPIKTVINSTDKTKMVLLDNLMKAYSDYITAVEINCQGLADIMRAEGYDRATVNDRNVTISYDLLFTALGKDDFFKRETIDRFEGISLINYYVYSGIILLILYGGLFAGLKVLKEKLGQVGVRLRSTGVSGVRYYGSSLCAFMLVYGSIMAVSMLAVILLGDLKVPPKALIFIMGAIAVSCVIFMFISRFINSVSGYMILGNMLILFTTIAGGGIIPIMYLPEGCAVVARFTPTYWFIKLILNSGI